MAGIKRAVRGNGVRFRGLTSEGRAYYRETWGFDPVADLYHVVGSIYRYEAWFPLDSDPGLAAVNLQIGARVDITTPVDYKGINYGEEEIQEQVRVQNQIVFRHRGPGENPPLVGPEGVVECTHTVVFVGPVDAALDLAEGNTLPIEDDGPPVTLPPWEHFAALKSYVAGIAEWGVGNLLRMAAQPGDTNDHASSTIGFNAEMQAQVMRALINVDAGAAWALTRDWLFDLVDVASPAWFAVRSEYFIHILRDLHYATKYRRHKTIPMDCTIPDILDQLCQGVSGEWVDNHLDKLAALFGDPVFKLGTRTYLINNGTLIAPDRDIQNLAELTAAAGDAIEDIEYIYLPGNKIVKIEGLERCQHLKVLDLNFNHITRIEGLSACRDLQEVKLFHNDITRLEGLTGLPSLSIVDLRSNLIQMQDPITRANEDALGPAVHVHLKNNPRRDTRISTGEKKSQTT